MPYRIAAIQDSPVYLDLDGTLDKVVNLVRESSENGADLVVFPEVFISGYPIWQLLTPPWSDIGIKGQRLLRSSSITHDDAAFRRLQRIARDNSVFLTIGVNELVGSTLYNSLMHFDNKGNHQLTHRKLMPTAGERLVWGYGDGSSLTAVAAPQGTMTGLICWENYMPLARQACYAESAQLHLAPTWDTSDEWGASLRHIAKEGRVFVAGVCQAMHRDDLSNVFPELTDLFEDKEWISPNDKGGGTAIIAPGEHGTLAGPLFNEKGILYAEIDPELSDTERLLFDPVGHYSRPDVLRLYVDRRQRSSVFHSEGQDDFTNLND